jgi:hypothetical protein
VHVVRGKNDRHTSIAIERSHEVADGQLRHRVETDRGLIEEEHARSVQHARGDLATHSLA